MTSRRSRWPRSPAGRFDGHAPFRRPLRKGLRTAAHERRDVEHGFGPDRAPRCKKQVRHQTVEPADLARCVRHGFFDGRRKPCHGGREIEPQFDDAKGLRTSCATPAATRPRAASRSPWASSRASASSLSRASASFSASVAMPSAISRALVRTGAGRARADRCQRIERSAKTGSPSTEREDGIAGRCNEQDGRTDQERDDPPPRRDGGQRTHDVRAKTVAPGSLLTGTAATSTVPAGRRRFVHDLDASCARLFDGLADGCFAFGRQRARPFVADPDPRVQPDERRRRAVPHARGRARQMLHFIEHRVAGTLDPIGGARRKELDQGKNQERPGHDAEQNDRYEAVPDGQFHPDASPLPLLRQF